MKTYSMKAGEIQKKWLIIDAKDLVLGRLAAEISKLLRGKHKPTYTPHMDCGDCVVVINAKHIHLSGHKSALKDGKLYYRHTGYPGGIKETTAGKILAGSHPERVLRMAVKRMISRNVLGDKQLGHLHVYAEDSHPHQAQTPAIHEFANLNRKNKK